MGTGTRYNVPLLEKIRDTIEDERKHHQDIWAEVERSALRKITERITTPEGVERIPVSCGTAACVAGWAVQIAGARLLVNTRELHNSMGCAEANSVVTPDGQFFQIGEYAREVLGLNQEEAGYLFAAHWTNEEVLDHIDAIIVAANHGRDWERDWDE